MRRHAKASTAGSTQRQASGLGRILRGAATRGASPELKGSSAPKAGRLAVSICALAAMLLVSALAAAPAGATKIHAFLEDFGSAAKPSFSSAQGIAIDQSSGDLLVIDAGNGTINRYNSDGTPANFSLLGTNVIDGAGAGDETPEGGLSFFGPTESQIAVDNSGGANDGNIYVTQGFPNVINVFAESGEYLGQLSAAGATEFSEACGVAVDPAGALYVGDLSGGVHKFAPAANPPLNADHTATFTGVSSPCTLAAGAGPSAGFLFVAQYFGEVFKVDSSTGEVKYAVSPGSNTTVTVDPASGNVFAVAEESDVREYDASGAASATQAALIDRSGSTRGVAVSGDIYLSSFSAIQVYDGAIATLADLTIEPATNNTGTKATLNGTVNPDGVELEECFFEYGKGSSFDQTVPCAESPAAIGSGTSPVPVHADISGLQPNGTFYQYRLVAVNADTTAKSGNESFTTPDTVITEPATGVTPEAATLNGTVNPDGEPITECLFEWGTTAKYGQTAPCVPNAAGIGSGTSPVAVSAGLSGLHPGTLYHFRLKAANANGPILGADETLQTEGPAIKATWSEDVVFTEATLKAEVNPEGVPTTYRFEWGTDTSYGNTSPEADVGSDNSYHELTLFLDGLQPGTTYHYRVVATNSDAVNEGEDHTFTTYEPFAAETNCANQEFRVGASANLPDCRAYEMVSPVDKNGGDLVTLRYVLSTTITRTAFDKSAAGGGKLTYSAYTAFAGAPGNRWTNQYMATRSQNGWVTKPISAPKRLLLDPFTPIYNVDSAFKDFSEDLSRAWMVDTNSPPLLPEAVDGFVNLYERDNTTDTHKALTTVEPTIFGGFETTMDIEPKGYTEDGRHALFEARAALTPDAAATTNVQIYDFSDGELHLVSVLPDGTANAGESRVGSAHDVGSNVNRGAKTHRAISEDGSHVVWSTVPGGDIYVRKNPAEEQSALGGGGECTEPAKACTIPVSESVTTAPSQYWTASTDGSKVAFTVSGGPLADNLYVFDVESETATLIAGEVTLLNTPFGGVVGGSEDLSSLYFVSKEALDAGATAGEWNLYHFKGGNAELVATLAESDVVDFSGLTAYGLVASSRPISQSSRLSADGRTLAFSSSRSLTGYDNTDAVSGEADLEVFHYDADTDELTCVSCKPSGARPVGGLLSRPYKDRGPSFDPDAEAEIAIPAAAWLPTWEHERHPTRVLSEDGNRLFFGAFDALVPQDTNGVADVYQWEAEGTGSCEEEGGCISLISTGKSPVYSEFVEASADGSEVFIRTQSGIAPQDPGLIDIYVARVNGGFPVPHEPPACVGDACQSPIAPPNDPTPASASFKGAGDPAPRKARRSCKARKRASKLSPKAKRKAAKRCRRANRGAAR